MEFTGPEQAVKFAQNVMERAEYARTDPMNVRSTSKENLSPLDLHAQAAMIMNAVDRLPPPERLAVLAMYGRGKDRSDAVRGLAEYLMPSVRGSVPGVREAQIVILSWATKRPSIRKIADEFDVSFRQVCKWRTMLLRAWLPLQVQAMRRLEGHLFSPSGFSVKP